ncbi:MAG: triose-phosphate isomerase [Treponema sp.]|nr:triose-phosphate isomerase [Treponema sp.]
MTGEVSMIKVPFFEFGPKAYLYGEKMIGLAEHADRLAAEYDVDIIIDPQTLDIPEMARRCRHIKVFAQHMDPIRAGRGMGSVLPEALKEWGAAGTLLNHTEKRLSLTDLESAVNRAREVGLLSMVCADNPDQAAAIALFAPDSIVVESPLLIGGGERKAGDNSVILEINARIRKINPGIRLLHSAGIKTADDIYNVIASGSDGAGSSSALALAPDPFKMFTDMVAAVRRAWDKRQSTVF